MNYWFLYTMTTGKIYGSPYLGETEEWTNIPDGCGVIGPFPEDNEIAIDAFQNPDCYKVVQNTLSALPNIGDIKAQKEAERQAQANLPSLQEQLKNLQQAFNEFIIGG